ncbi:MAG: hypothetical protein ACWA5L_05775 [bacterium]
MKKSITKTLLAGAASLLAIACSSVGDQLSDVVFMPNANSQRTTEDMVELRLAFSTKVPPEPVREESDTYIDTESYIAGLPATAAGPAGGLAAAAISQIGLALARESEKYTASYSAEAANDGFYHEDQPSGMTEMNAAGVKEYSDIRFAGFKFIRQIPSPTGQESYEAMAVCTMALPGRTDNIFYLIPISYQMTYSKAKLIGFDLTSPFGVDLLNPWEIITDPISGQGFNLPPSDNTVDMTMAVSFEYLSFGYDGVQSITAGPDTFDVKGAKVTGKPVTGYFPAYKNFIREMGSAYELPCDAGTDETDIAALRDKIMTLPMTNINRMRLSSGAKLYPVAPRAMGNGHGNGNFMIKVEMTEFDDYGDRIQEVSGAFDRSAPSLQEQLTDFFDGN